MQFLILVIVLVVGCLLYSRTHEELTVKILYHADIDEIVMTDGGNWIDLRAAEDVTMKAGESKLISLGISMKLPNGYEAVMLPRSSTFPKYGILMANSQGVIDNNYSGNVDIWKFSAYATRDTVVKKNERICQFRLQKIQKNVRFNRVPSLSEDSRGGFGSTGIN